MKNESRVSRKEGRFHFNDVVVDPELRARANLRLVELLALAPPAARATGQVERVDGGFVVAVEIDSPFRTFSAESFSTDAKKGIYRALERLEDHITQWRFGGADGSQRSSSAGGSSNLPWARSR